MENNEIQSLYDEKETEVAATTDVSPIEKPTSETEPVKEEVKGEVEEARQTDFEINDDGEFETPEGYVTEKGLVMANSQTDPKEYDRLRSKTMRFELSAASGDYASTTAKLMFRTNGFSKEHTRNLDQESRLWISEASMATQTMLPELNGINYTRINTRRDARWTNSFTSGVNGRPLGINTPVLKQPKGVEMISGKRALDLFDAASNLGRRVQVQLFHTGISVVIRSPTLSQYIELSQMIADEKVALGHRTKGAIFSNESVYTYQRICNMILAHVEETNALSSDPKYLADIIDIRDLDTLMWACMSTHHPRGFNLSIPCSASLDCNHVESEIVNLRKMLFIDASRFNEKQIKILSRASAKEKIQPQDLQVYQEEFPAIQTSRAEILVPGQEDPEETTKVVLYFKQPKLSEFFAIGHEWVNTIELGAMNAFANAVGGTERTKYVNEQAVATAVLQYAHFIDYIELVFDDGIGKVTEAEDVHRILNRLSSHVETRDIALQAINDYINDSLHVVIGHPNYICPECGKAHATRYSASRHIVPFDALSTFFTHAQALRDTQR